MDQIQELLATLQGNDGDSEAYLLNPEAQTDWSAFRGLSQQNLIASQRSPREDSIGRSEAAG